LVSRGGRNCEIRRDRRVPRRVRSSCLLSRPKEQYSAFRGRRNRHRRQCRPQARDTSPVPPPCKCDCTQRPVAARSAAPPCHCAPPACPADRAAPQRLRRAASPRQPTQRLKPRPMPRPPSRLRARTTLSLPRTRHVRPRQTTISRRCRRCGAPQRHTRADRPTHPSCSCTMVRFVCVCLCVCVCVCAMCIAGKLPAARLLVKP